MCARTGRDDAELVRRAMEGDREAYGALVERYQRAAYAVAFSVTGRHEDAEDAAQEAFLVALRRLEDCRSPDRFGSWLLTTVRNRARNLMRRERLRSSDAMPPEVASKRRSPLREAEMSEVTELLRVALMGLPQVQREVVLLHDLQGWKHREIAERMELPEGTVRSHLHYARRSLRSALEVLDPQDRQEVDEQE